MSSIVNKVKEAVHGHKSSDPEGTHGPHSSRTANAADPRIDSDRDGRAAPRTTGGFDSTTTGTHGTHGAGVTGSNYTTSTNAGPHDSNAANKLDPRVDSDRDGSRTVGGNNYGTTGTHGSSGLTGTHGSSGLTGNNYNTSTNAGPHDSNVANKLDPRVDSDRDGSRTAGGNTYGSSGVTGTHGSSGLTGTHGSSGLTGNNYNTSTNAGPHDSNVANKLDPRVDSDRDGSRTAGGNTYGSSGVTGTHGSSGLTGTHGTHGTTGMTGTPGSSGLTGSGYNTSTNAGPHDSNVANKLDPRVDSDRDNSRTVGGNNYGSSGMTGTHGTHGTSGLTGTHSGPGPAPNTAGPHKSDALNKMDPRVDSDRDGSKTLGQDKTYQADPTDAAQVPPSTLRKHIGEPEVAHDDHHHGRARRNSKPSAQEGHRGL